MAVPQTLNASLIEEMRRRLRDMRQRLFRTVATTNEELATLEGHQPGGPVEDVTHDTVATLLSRLGAQERRELDEVFAAQARLETGTFGACGGCSRPIPLARLRAMPTARSCIACQAREEGRAR
jgi:RNA polymerase-binding protein DksA